MNGTKGGRGRRDNGWREVKGISAAFKKLAGNSLTSLGFRGAQVSQRVFGPDVLLLASGIFTFDLFLARPFPQILVRKRQMAEDGLDGTCGKIL